MTHPLIKDGFSAQYRVTDGSNFHLESLNIDYPTLSEEVQSNLQGYIQQLQNE